MTPSVPALAAGRSYFTNVEQVTPGCRTELPRIGAVRRHINLWRPDPDAPQLAHRRLRRTLAESVALRAKTDPTLSSDLSGGLDSTTITVLAAHALPVPHRLSAVTIHPEGSRDGFDLRYAQLTAAASGGQIVHHPFPWEPSTCPTRSSPLCRPPTSPPLDLDPGQAARAVPMDA